MNNATSHPTELRSSERDILVTVGSGDDTKEYRYHSQMVAILSEYVDRALNSGFRESHTKHLSFPDITPSTWEKMIDFVTNPVKIREMTVEDAFELVAQYDKYNFHSGVQVCEKIAVQYFSELSDSGPVDSLDDAVLFLGKAAELPMPESREAGLMWLGKRFLQYGRLCHQRYGRCIFTKEHFRTLAPLLAEAKEEFEDFRAFTKEEISSTLFPELITLRIKSDYDNEVLEEVVKKISLGYRGNDDIVMFPDSRIGGLWRDDGRNCLGVNGITHDLYLFKRGDWLFVGQPENSARRFDPRGENEVLLCRCRHSHLLPFPPTEGWAPIHYPESGLTLKWCMSDTSDVMDTSSDHPGI